MNVINLSTTLHRLDQSMVRFGVGLPEAFDKRIKALPPPTVHHRKPCLREKVGRQIPVVPRLLRKDVMQAADLSVGPHDGMSVAK